MATNTKIPYMAQDPEEIKQLVAALDDAAKKGKAKGGFSVRGKQYQLSQQDPRFVKSWSMSDWDYKKPDLPTYARGLFTWSNNGQTEIAVRGYDKFFNVGEVQKTQWENVVLNTRGPYELSVKENGCIIFIAGLDDDTIIVTSKHATGPRTDGAANHAHAGEQWIDRQLLAIGRKRSELAKDLRSRNVTAVAELCDDEFEEHVLEYTPEHAGLYLHGLNLNLPEFATYPGNLVHQFADEWGFKKAQYVIKETIEDVKPFLDNVAETGNYEGRDTEGFVIRCQVRDSKDAPWMDWFFKYKFEEPYLMYRQWREVTKAIIASKIPKFNKHKQITQEYITYARTQLSKDPSIGKLFNQNHGIIKMREGFLAHKGLRGHEIIQSEEQNGEGTGSDVTKNVFLVPVATLGCGKTTVATALAKLFGWGHEQNDNIAGKGRMERFAMALTNSVASHPVVIADRNNHQKRERAQLFEDIKPVVPDATFICLHWVHDRGNYAEIRRAMQERIFARGDKHQTIHAGTKSQGEIVGIMDGFMSRFEPVDHERRPDEEFDQVIDLDVAATSRENLATAINQLHDAYPKLFDLPSDEAMDKAIAYALEEYEPTIKHELSKGPRGKEDKNKQNGKASAPQNGSASQQRPITREPRIEFFGAYLPTARLNSILDALFSSSSSTAEKSHFYTQLKSSRRVQRAFHVTLMHRASEAQEPEYWRKLNEIWKEKATRQDPCALTGGTDGGVDMGSTRVQLERVVWDGRVMAVVVRMLDAEWKSVNPVAHITVGTAGDAIKPKESNDLLARWMQGKVGKEAMDVKVPGNVVLDCNIKGMLSR